MQVWDVETGVAKSCLEMDTVVRSIGLSYSGNLVVFTTRKPNAKASVYVQDIRALSKINNLMTADIDCESFASLFTHMDDCIAYGLY